MNKQQKQEHGGALRFGGKVLGEDEARKKMEVAEKAADRLDELNDRYPDLASDFTRSCVTLTRQRLSEAEEMLVVPETVSDELIELVSQLITNHGVDEVLDILEHQHGVVLDVTGLIHVIGVKEYQRMLRHEAAEYQQNFLSEEQIAELWNEARLPVPGGAAVWKMADVQELLKG